MPERTIGTRAVTYRRCRRCTGGCRPQRCGPRPGGRSSRGWGTNHRHGDDSCCLPGWARREVGACAGGAFLGTVAKNVEDPHWTVNNTAGLAQFGHQARHDFANGSALVIAGAPAAGGVGPFPALLNTVEDGFNCAVTVAGGEFESHAVVGCMLGGEFGHALPVGLAQVGVHDHDTVKDTDVGGCPRHYVKRGLRVLARRGIHHQQVVVVQSRTGGPGYRARRRLMGGDW
jgi:hypothetical protein